MSEAIRFTAELEGLLAEAARDPRSGLLRLPRRSGVRSYYTETEEKVSRWAPELTRLERHLVDAHREELALALRQLFALEIVRRPDQQGRTFWSTDERDAPRYPSEEGLRARFEELELRARAEDLAARTPPEAETAFDLLRRALGADRKPLDLLALATLAARLEPTPTARHYVAKALLADGQPAAALRYASFMASSLYGRRHTFLGELIGNASITLGLVRLAEEAYRGAVLEGGSLQAACYWLKSCILAADAERAKEAARRIDGQPRDDRILQAVCAALRNERESGRWDLGRDGQVLVAELTRSAGENVGRILDAIRT